MISKKQPYTYTDKGCRFYYFRARFDVVRSMDGTFRDFDSDNPPTETEKRFKGFHAYLFDQNGKLYECSPNSTHTYEKTKGDGIFYASTIWEADGCPFHDPLDAYRGWVGGERDIDLAYALETVHQILGLDLMLLKRGKSVNEQ